MKQTFKKKPEFLYTVYVEDDSQSIKDIYELVGVDKANITFNDNGERIIIINDDLQIPVGHVVFKDKKTGKFITMPKDKLLQFYDEFNQEYETE